MTDVADSAEQPAEPNSMPAPSPVRTPREPKGAIVKRLLGRTRGASIAEIETFTDWKPHSVRAFLSGLRKQGLSLIREERRNGDQVYRLVKEPVASRPDAA